MRYKAIVSYDGSRYIGWQKQPKSNTIQETIEKAMFAIHHYPVDIIASGRTDAGVHAYAQVFHFDSEMKIDDNSWCSALNALLPKDIRMQKVIVASDDFHARFNVVSKRYDFLVTDQMSNPFLENYMAKVYQQLDVPFMQECAKVFLGTHDFTTFTSNKIDSRKNRVKTIQHLNIIEEEGYIRMIFVGSGFLRYMVRMLAQTLIEAGKHKLTQEEVKSMLEAKDKHVCHYKATGNGLYLMHVSYGGEEDESELSYTYPTMFSCHR